jgi:hypothetical protein
MLPGQELHLDHNDMGGGYLGFSHKVCNLRAAAKKARRKQLARRVVSRPRTTATVGDAGRLFGGFGNFDLPLKSLPPRGPTPVAIKIDLGAWIRNDIARFAGKRSRLSVNWAGHASTASTVSRRVGRL